MVQLTFNETTWEFKTYYGETTSIHIFKNGERLQNWNIQLLNTDEDNCKIAKLVYDELHLPKAPNVIIYDNIFKLEDVVKIISFIK